jgi:hypothetical protein
MDSTVTSSINIKNEKDRRQIADLLARAGVLNGVAVLSFACDHLTDDWLTVWDEQNVRLNCRANADEVMDIKVWAEVLWALFQLRNESNITEQIRRLNLLSLEKVNNAITFLIASRYIFRGYTVRLEPNGPAGSDLLIEGNGFRVYAEIKNENAQQVHPRQVNWHRRALRIIERLRAEHSKSLRDRGLRLEIRFGGLFSDETIPRILEEIGHIISTAETGVKTEIPSVNGSVCHFLPGDVPFTPLAGKSIFFSGRTELTPNGPVQVANLDVIATLPMPPNLHAVKGRIKDALRQLAKERRLDPASGCMIVLLVLDADYVSAAIQKRMMTTFPRELLGVVVISSQARYWTHVRVEQDDAVKQFLAWAGRSIWASADDAESG